MNDTDTREQVIQWIPFDRLILDDENPRFPEGLRGASQSEILKFLHDQDVLEELAQSYLDNGFFRHEPLIVVQERGKRYTVVEGNRRLAALKILHDSPEADDAGFFGIDPSGVQLETLVEIPCFLIPDRDQIHAYIGFRHIGGLKTWPPEAKARYCWPRPAGLWTRASMIRFESLAGGWEATPKGSGTRTSQSASCSTQGRSSV